MKQEAAWLLSSSSLVFFKELAINVRIGIKNDITAAVGTESYYSADLL